VHHLRFHIVFIQFNQLFKEVVNQISYLLKTKINDKRDSKNNSKDNFNEIAPLKET